MEAVFYAGILGLCCQFVVIGAFSAGAGSGACGPMIPGHQGTNPKTSASPYTITPSTTTLTAGGTITVTLAGANFKGFMAQVRGVGTTTNYGTWTQIPSGTKKMCTGDVAVTHDSSATKSNVELVWQAPATLPNTDLEFVVTFVQAFSTYWAGQQSSALSPQSTGGGPTPAPGPTTTTSTTTPSPTVPQADITVDVSSCAISKNCFLYPEGCSGSQCDFIATWAKADADTVNFELKGKSDGYIALGLSEDKSMDGTKVIACVKQNDGQVQVSHYYNSGYSSLPVSPGGQDGITNAVGSSQDGYVTCTFTREVTVTNDKVANLDKEYYLMVAMGPATGSVGYHSSTPKVTSDLITPTAAEFSAVGGGADISKLEQAHAILMISAWMFCASLGLILARYYKGTWASSSLCGEKVWFALHRALMVINLLCTLSAFVIIFIDARRWSTWGVTYQDAHPIIGTVVTGLVILNPLMALCRPHPDEPKRPIFNWAHWFVGTGAHTLAIVNIFIGMMLPSSKSFTPRVAMWILVAFVVVHVLVEIMLEIQKCRANDARREQEMEMTNINQPKAAAPPKESSFLRTIIGFYILAALGLWAAIVVLMIL